jgi:hypothetical protein
MAKKKSGGSKKGAKRSSSKKKNPPRRRRRNPSTFLDRVGRLAGVAAIGLGTAAAVTIGQAKIMPGNAATLYGIPAATFLVGAAAYRTMPTLGAGLAIGSVAPFALPIASKALALTTPSTPAATAAGIARSMRNMRAVSMGRGRMGAIDMGAVDMSAVYAG